MHLPRKLLPVLAAGIATLSFAGVSAALEADAAPEAPPADQVPADENEPCLDRTGTPEGDETTTDVADEADEADEASEADEADF